MSLNTDRVNYTQQREADSGFRSAKLPGGFRSLRSAIISEHMQIEQHSIFPSDAVVAVFDLNGTVLETEQAYREALRRATELLLSRNISQEEWQEIKTAWHMTDTEAARTVLSILHSRQEDRMPIVSSELRKHGITRLKTLQNQILKAESDTLPVSLIPGVRNILDTLMDKGCSIGLATNSPPEHAKAFCKTLALTDVFRYSTFTLDLPADTRKPHPEVYKRNLYLQGINPLREHCVGFENSVSGALSSFQAGLDTFVLVADGDFRSFSIAAKEMVKELSLPEEINQYPHARIRLLNSWSQVQFSN